MTVLGTLPAKGPARRLFGIFRPSVRNGSIAALGSPGHFDGSGKVSVFQWKEGDWVLLGSDVVLGSAAGAGWGIPWLWCHCCHGAPYSDKHRGSALVLDYSSITDAWEQRGKVLKGDTEGAQFGYPVAISASGGSDSAGQESARHKTPFRRTRIFIWTATRIVQMFCRTPGADGFTLVAPPLPGKTTTITFLALRFHSPKTGITWPLCHHTATRDLVGGRGAERVQFFWLVPSPIYTRTLHNQPRPAATENERQTCSVRKASLIQEGPDIAKAILRVIT